MYIVVWLSIALALQKNYSTNSYAYEILYIMQAYWLPHDQVAVGFKP